MKNKNDKTLREITENWLMKNSGLLNKVAFDRKARIPEGTIQKFVKHNQKINDKRIRSIHRIIKKLELNNYNKKKGNT